MMMTITAQMPMHLAVTDYFASVEFREPMFLLMALLAPVVLILLLRGGQTLAAYSDMRLLATGGNQKAPGITKTWRTRTRRLPECLIALAMILLSVGMAGPRTPDATTKINRKGLAIMMAVDRSGSMNARDMVADDTSINRLQVVKKLFTSFVTGQSEDKKGAVGKGRPDDVIGLIAFARYPDGLCPLTLDHGNLITIAKDLEIVNERHEDGTAMGEGLALAVERLRKHPARSKVAILLTDGVSNAGEIDPKQAGELALAQGVKVYTIGVGSQGWAPIPVQDPFTGQTVLRRYQVQIDEESLRQIADKTGGRYYRASDADSLAQIYREIDQLERTEITETRYLQYHEHYAGWVLAALALMGAASLLNQSLFRSFPA